MSPRAIRSLVLAATVLLLAPEAHAAAGDVIFVTQTPHPYDFTTAVATFGNHRASLDSVARGGDLWIRYASGTLKNLTEAAGYGMSGFQGAGAIAVRDPAVHWDGTKIVFSMVIGAPTQQFQVQSYRWQLYEMTGLGPLENPVITKVPNQPAEYNNVMPVYGTDDRIIFVSDRPRNGAAHHYPQRDEYESAPTNTGIWSLDPSTGSLVQLDHSPSGDFDPIVDSFGRIVFTRWDHMQRDQQAGIGNSFNSFNYADESANAARLETRFEFYPEGRTVQELDEVRQNPHRFNHFFPWQINEDGTEHETLNHIGRHELHSYFDRAFNDDSNLDEFNPGSRFNQSSIGNFFHIQEDPTAPGWYYGIDAPEFGTHAAGQVIKISGAPHVSANTMSVVYVTHRDTSSPDDTPSVNHSGFYRNPLPLSNGALIASHTSETREDTNEGTREAPISRYAFRLKTLVPSGAHWISGAPLTTGIVETVSWFDPDVLVTYSGPLWELQPVELVARTRPPRRHPSLEAPEQSAFAAAGVDPAAFRQYLFNNGLALIVTRNTTTRDSADLQQPFNLRVPGGAETVVAPGKIYDISHLQIFQGDLIRGYNGTANPSPGRRVLAAPQHEGSLVNPANPGGPAGSVRVASDGSLAAVVPARRALTWQLTDATGKGVVRERYWLTFQPGEIRLCASCHGLTDVDQAGRTAPQNVPQALVELLVNWKTNGPPSNPDAPPPAPGDPSNPDQPPAPPPPTTPSYQLHVMTAVRNGFVPGLLTAGKKGVLIALPASGNTASQPVTMFVSLNGLTCPVPVETFTTAANGSALLMGTTPSTRTLVAVRFSLGHGTSIVGTIDTTIGKPPRRGLPKPLSARDFMKMCQSFSKYAVVQ